MMKKVFGVVLVFSFFLAFSSSIEISAQSSCECANSTCSVSQTCPAGRIAVCVCEATGCSSSCEDEGFPGPENPGENLVASRLEKVDAAEYPKVLTSILGKRVTFEPSSENFSFADLDYKAGSGTHWDVLAKLNRYGELKIDGFSLEFWMNRRETLLKGGEFAFCVSSASVNRILKEISFITGKNFLIVSGDGNQQVKGKIEGTILSEVLDSLSKAGGVTIVER